MYASLHKRQHVTVIFSGIGVWLCSLHSEHSALCEENKQRHLPRQQLGDSHNANKVKVNTGQPVLEINVGTGASKNIIIIQSYLVGSAVQGRARCSVDRKQLINSVAFSLLGRKDIHMYKVILSEPTRYWSVVVYWLENN